LVLKEIELTITTNTTLVGFWKSHTKIDFYDEVLLQEKETLLTLFSAVNDLIKQKANTPIEALNIEKLIDFQLKLEEEVSRFKECNKIIAQYNLRINEIKNTESKSLQTLEEELKSLKLNQLRFQEKGKEFAKKYLDIEKKIGTLNVDKEEKQGELREYTTTTLATYKVTINRLLKKFASYMEIKEIKSAYVSTSKVPSVEYVLSVSGNNVKLNDDGINPSFKYVLSEGDKSTLAISFFFAMLVEDQHNLSNKIVVFDDPVSSFDRSRLFETVKILHWVASKSKQLFVLTHNLGFAGEFYYQYQKRSEIQPLQIFQANNQSHLEEFLIEVETLPDLLKDLETITRYLKDGAKDEIEKLKVKRCLRPILEGYYKMKFYGIIQENDWLGGFIKKTKEAKDCDKLFRIQPHLTELEAVNDWTSDSHHGSTGQQTIDDQELRAHTEMTLELIEKI
jgi:wobble nucleotide-excising tRNase